MKEWAKRAIVIFALILGLKGIGPVFAKELKQNKVAVEQQIEQKPIVLECEIEGNKLKIELERPMIYEIRESIGLLDKIKLAGYFEEYSKNEDAIEKKREADFKKVSKFKAEIDSLEWKFYKESKNGRTTEEQDRIISSRRKKMKEFDSKSSSAYFSDYDNNDKLLYERIYRLLAPKLAEIAKRYDNKPLIIWIECLNNYSPSTFSSVKSLGLSIADRIR